MSGFELLELLEDGDVDLNQVPIVVLSAFTFPPSAADSAGGVKACLSKPVKAALLLQTVDACYRRTAG
jgi:CheY-like chemotaxis protein